jgi:hypothetical protein
MMHPAGGQPPAGLSASRGLTARRALLVFLVTHLNQMLYERPTFGVTQKVPDARRVLLLRHTLQSVMLFSNIVRLIVEFTFDSFVPFHECNVAHERRD